MGGFVTGFVDLVASLLSIFGFVLIAALVCGWLRWTGKAPWARGPAVATRDDVDDLLRTIDEVTAERDRTLVAFTKLLENLREQVQVIRDQRDSATRQLGTVLYQTRAPSTQALIDGYSAWRRLEAALDSGPCWFQSNTGSPIIYDLCRCNSLETKCERCRALRGEDAGG